MNTVVFITLVAFAAAGPTLGSFDNAESPFQRQFYPLGQTGQQYMPRGKDFFHVAQYIAYQFHQAQQLGYTPAQVFEYLQEQGFPVSVAEYLSEQYEAGLAKPHFQTPYQMFQYYYQQGVSQDAQEYIAQQLSAAYQQYQRHSGQYGQEAYDQGFAGVPHPISQYLIQQARYYGQNGAPYSAAQNGFQQLQRAQQYAQNALKYFVNGDIPQQTYQYVYEQLQQGVARIQNIQSLVYQEHQQGYIPYYAAQYYAQQAQEAYRNFQNAYQFTQQKSQGAVPQSFVQQVQFAVIAVQRAIQYYQQSQPGPYSSLYSLQGPLGSSGFQYASFSPYTSSAYQFGSYRPSTYRYGTSGSYGSFAFQYGSSLPYSSSAYQYGSYSPYFSSSYGFGSYRPYSSQYGFASYGQTPFSGSPARYAAIAA